MERQSYVEDNSMKKHPIKKKDMGEDEEDKDFYEQQSEKKYRSWKKIKRNRPPRSKREN